MEGYITTKNVTIFYTETSGSMLEDKAQKGTIYIPENLIIMPPEQMPRRGKILEFRRLGLIENKTIPTKIRNPLPAYLRRVEIDVGYLETQIQIKFLQMADSKLEELLTPDWDIRRLDGI